MDRLVWPINGFMALIYLSIENLALIITLLSLISLILSAPREQRGWLGFFFIPALLASAFVPPPVPQILAGMSLGGAIFVRLDRFNPHALRWRVATGIILYSLAALAFSFYLSYASRISPQTWAKLLGSTEEAAALLQTGRSFMHTLGVWGIWLIIPLGYFSLLLQGFLAHPPAPLSPADVVRRVRERRERESGEEELI